MGIADSRTDEQLVALVGLLAQVARDRGIAVLGLGDLSIEMAPPVIVEEPSKDDIGRELVRQARQGMGGADVEHDTDPMNDPGTYIGGGVPGFHTFDAEAE